MLADAELVTPRTNGTREYVFKHPLTQEVANSSQLSERRARTHRAVGVAIERTYPDGLDERAALLAHHSEAAGDKLEAAEWHARAAAWAGVTSLADGMRHWQRVRDLAGELDSSPEVSELATKARIGILGLAWRLGMSPEETAAIYAEGQERGEAGEPAVPVGRSSTSKDEEPEPEARDREALMFELSYCNTLAFGGREREELSVGTPWAHQTGRAAVS